MRTRAVAAIAALTAGAAIIASAASLNGLTSATVQSDSAAVPSCDANGFDARHTVAAGKVTKVTVKGIADPACEGGTMKVTLADAGVSIGSGSATVPTDGDTADNSVTITIAAEPNASLVDDTRMEVVGP